MKEKTVQNLTKFAFAIFLLSVPFSYVYSLNFLGNNKSYTAFALYNVYLVDLTAIFLVLILLLNPYWHKKSFLTPLLVFPMFVVLSTFWSGSPFLSAFWGLRLLIIILAITAVIKLMQKTDYYRGLFFKLIIAGGVAEGLIALGQFIFQRSLGLYILGESHLGPDILGLTRVDLLGHSFIRAYGTFPHPNVLGGFLLFTFIATIWYIISNKPTGTAYMLFLPIIQLVGLGLTFSRSAILGLLLILIITWCVSCNVVILAKARIQKKSFIVLLLILFSLLLVRSPIQNILSGRDPSIKLRLEYARAAYSRFLESPIIGRGWGTGPIELPAFSNFPYYSWELQPVHNIYLLVLSDLGIIGLLIFLYFVYRVLNSHVSQSLVLSSSGLTRGSRNNLRHFLDSGSSAGMTKGLWSCLFIAYLFIGFFDHYLLTLPQGIFIFFASALMISVASAQKTEKTPRRV